MVGAHQIGRRRLVRHTHAIVFAPFGQLANHLGYVVVAQKGLIHQRIARVGVLAVRAEKADRAVAKELDERWIGLKRAERVKYGHPVDAVVQADGGRLYFGSLRVRQAKLELVDACDALGIEEHRVLAV